MNLNEIEKFATKARRNLTAGVKAALSALDMEHEPTPVQGGWLHQGKDIDDLEFGQRWRKLSEIIRREGEKVAIERAAYTWFNRLVAIRILAKRCIVPAQLEWADKAARVPRIVHRMRTGAGTPNLTPGEDAALARVKADPTKTREQFAILVGAFCRETPMLRAAFGEIDDWTILLVPGNLLAEDGLVDDLNNSELLSDADYASDELIGWLYQYYIAERKAEVYDGFKKNKKAGVAEIPAATQIFTPNWIVKYLVENALKGMDETASFTDPCCGSGHILLEGFRHFLAVYDDLGYSKREAIKLIFERNIVGIDIDPRARQLSTFALLLAATKEDEWFKDAKVLPCVFDTATPPEKADVSNALSTSNAAAIKQISDALTLLRENGDNIGSLLKLDLSPETRKLLEMRLGDVEDEDLKRIFGLMLALTGEYDALVTNPPYLGAGNLNTVLKQYLEKHYKDGKNDLFAAFILRLLDLCKSGGRVGMITMESWMFLSSYEKLRKRICEDYYIASLGHFDWYIIGIAFGTSMFVVEKAPHNERKGEYSYLTIEDVDPLKNVPYVFPKKDNGRYATTDQRSFSRIPGSPIAYWASEKVIGNWSDRESLGQDMITREGMATADNPRFLRYWHEVSQLNCDISESEEKSCSLQKWYPYNKGGEYRKWYGNNSVLVDWWHNGIGIKNNRDPISGRIRSHNYNGEYAFHKGVTWSALTSGMLSVRYSPAGFLWDSKGAMGFSHDDTYYLGLLNSVVAKIYLEIISPTKDFKVGDIIQIPVVGAEKDVIRANVIELISLSRSDWDEYETSWDFKVNPLVREGWQRSGAAMCLETAWAAVFARRLEWAERMKTLEEENNRLFIEAYGLQDELSPDVAWKDVSITGNPAYRYKLDGDQQSGEDLARADAMRELISYGMGVLMGRYSLEQEGLILASQGELYKDYIARVHGAGKILPDEDGVIPAITLEGGFFKDNLLHRMREFLSAAFGNDALPQNLNFIEAALGCGFDKYLTDKFFDDHVKTYKKRPIYWLFESPKGYFRAFAYMHRMTGATAGHIRNNYLLPYIGHLEKCFAAEVAKGSAMTSAERKRVKAMEAAIKDCKAYDLVLHDFADQSVAIDLDDGVVVNWKKYESVLAKL